MSIFDTFSLLGLMFWIIMPPTVVCMLIFLCARPPRERTEDEAMEDLRDAMRRDRP